MALTKVTKVGITNDAVDGDKLKDGSITTAKIGASAIESSEINDGTITVDDLAGTLNLSSKTVTLPNTSVTAGMLSNTLDLSSKTVTLSGSTVAALKQPIQDNIGLLGFKMAVNDGLTVFNLVDGVVDEFHDESGTDEAEGSNDVYCATEDSYANYSYAPYNISAGFTTTSITEPDTSTAGTNPAGGVGTFGQFTVPSAVTSVNIYAFGAGGGGSPTDGNSPTQPGEGGGGGYATGTLAVTPGQVMEIVVGEGGYGGTPQNPTLGGGGEQTSAPSPGHSRRGGGASAIITNDEGFAALQNNAPKAPQVFLVAGGGGGGGHLGEGGGGGGLTGFRGGQASPQSATTSSGTFPNSTGAGGGGDQEQGGQGADGPASDAAEPGSFLKGGSCSTGPAPQDNVDGGTGGGGYYGGGGGPGGNRFAGGGGSSYYGQPQITSGATQSAGNGVGGGEAAATCSPLYIACTSEANTPGSISEDGYVLITASGCNATPGGSTTITSEAFASGTVATSARIVVFEENVDTPTLNTDIIASVSRDAGVTFTTATLADSGYVTGSSGQRILTGQADISGQPSGQSMRWKLALANNTVKIHGVSLQWS